VAIEPAAVDLKVTLANAETSTIQPLLPFRATVRGRLDATLAFAGPLAPAPRVSLRGDATLREVAVGDGDTRVLTVTRIDLSGIDGVWPERVALDRVRVRRAWALIQRDRQGNFLLQRLFERRTPAMGLPAAPAGVTAPATAPVTAFSVRELIFE